MNNYQAVIGLECHVQLATKSKLFCGCDNDSREAEPNTNVCPVCMGFPGSLPVLNEQAVRLALRAGYALRAEIPDETKFDRKNYFYPDLPLGYQITQFDQPIVGRGSVEAVADGQSFTVGITRAHLEADAGKLTHPEGADYSLVDLNRASTPLLEIVSEPDMRTPTQAKGYAQELYNLMRYAEVSDANLYYGNMRFDVNVSVHQPGTPLGTRTETKNLNSFRAVERAAEYEIERQIDVLESGGSVLQETRGWDEAGQRTLSQRSKEDAHDYRYFPEPDLPPVVITQALRDEASDLPIMPWELRAALSQAAAPRLEAEALIAEPALARLWQQVHAQHPQHARFALHWLMGDQVKLAETKGQSLGQSQITAPTIAAVGALVADGQLSSTNAKALLARLWDEEGDARQLAEQHGLLQQSDSAELDKIIAEVIAAHPDPVAQYRAGETKVIGFLVGQVMKQSRGAANPPLVNQLLKKQLED